MHCLLYIQSEIHPAHNCYRLPHRFALFLLYLYPISLSLSPGAAVCFSSCIGHMESYRFEEHYNAKRNYWYIYKYLFRMYCNILRIFSSPGLQCRYWISTYSASREYLLNNKDFWFHDEVLSPPGKNHLALLFYVSGT